MNESVVEVLFTS